MVREDLIRPVNPSLFGLPDSHCVRGTASCSWWGVTHAAPNSWTRRVTPWLGHRCNVAWSRGSCGKNVPL